MKRKKSTPIKQSQSPKKQELNTTKSENKFSFSLAAMVVVLCMATFYVYKGSLDNDFVNWDDNVYVIDNNLVRGQNDVNNTASLIRSGNRVSPFTTKVSDIFQRPVSLNYHPLTILSMRWNNNACPECFYGISAKPFLYWNLVLHILNVVLVFLLMYWFSNKHVIGSLAAAALFALHPMHVESVAWVSERKDVLYVFFFLTALLCYTRFLKLKSRFWWITTFVLFLFSCLSKATAVVFPLVLLLLLFWKDDAEKPIESLKRSLDLRKWRHTIPFFLVSLFFGLMAVKVQSGENFLGLLELPVATEKAISDFNTFGLWQRVQFASYGFLQYIFKFFAPHGMSTFYAYPTEAEYQSNSFFTLAPFLAMAIFAATIYSLKRTKIVLFGIAFYLVTVVLVLQFISVGAVIMADRYTYLPYIGLGFILIMLIIKYVPAKQQTVSFALIGAFCLFLGNKTIAQVETWEDSEALWTQVIETHTNENGVRKNMAEAFSTRADFYARNGEYAGVVLQNQPQQQANFDKAFADYLEAEKLGSKKPAVYEGMGNIYGMKQEIDKALAAYSKAIELNPQNGNVYFNRGVTYGNIGQHDKAYADFTKVIELKPDMAVRALSYRGFALANMGRREEALADYQEVLKLEPGNQFVIEQMRVLTGN